MTSIPTEFPTGGPLEQAGITPTQIKTAVKDLEDALGPMREKYGGALAATSIEGKALVAAENMLNLAQALAGKL